MSSHPKLGLASPSRKHETPVDPLKLPARAGPLPGHADAADIYRKIAAGNVKGTLLISRMNYLRSLGVEDSERVLRRMLSADQQVLRGMLLPSSWYPADLILRLEMTIAAILSHGDRRRMFLDMGRFTADTNLGPNGIQRPYLKEGDPHYILRNVPRMYSSQHSDGERTYEGTGPTSAVIRTISGEIETEEDCFTTIGWLKRAVELSRGRIVTVEEQSCRMRGGHVCEYVCRWA